MDFSHCPSLAVLHLASQSLSQCTHQLVCKQTSKGPYAVLLICLSVQLLITGFLSCKFQQNQQPQLPNPQTCIFQLSLRCLGSSSLCHNLGSDPTEIKFGNEGHLLCSFLSSITVLCLLCSAWQTAPSCVLRVFASQLFKAEGCVQHLLLHQGSTKEVPIYH